jgi:hypothetical protein
MVMLVVIWFSSVKIDLFLEVCDKVFVHPCSYIYLCLFIIQTNSSSWCIAKRIYTVKRVDEVVRRPHLVTQDQFTQVLKKVSDIPVENFTINIELFWQNFSYVELLRQKWFVWKVTSPGREPMSSDIHSSTLPLRHTFFLVQEHTEGYKPSQPCQSWFLMLVLVAMSFYL